MKQNKCLHTCEPIPFKRFGALLDAFGTLSNNSKTDLS